MGLLSSRMLERMMPCTLATSNAIATRETSSVRRLINWRSRDYVSKAQELTLSATGISSLVFIPSCRQFSAVSWVILFNKPLASEIAYTRLHTSSRITESAKSFFALMSGLLSCLQSFEVMISPSKLLKTFISQLRFLSFFLFRWVTSHYNYTMTTRDIRMRWTCPGFGFRSSKNLETAQH
jgi:hypothetical protein